MVRSDISANNGWSTNLPVVGPDGLLPGMTIRAGKDARTVRCTTVRLYHPESGYRTLRLLNTGDPSRYMVFEDMTQLRLIVTETFGAIRD